jgi:hypothetical protein
VEFEASFPLIEMRCDLDFFKGAELHLLYMARRLREALAVETVLGQAEIEYFVEPGPYEGGFLFRRELTGAFFYVLPADLPRAREVLLRHKYRPYEQDVQRSA